MKKNEKDIKFRNTFLNNIMSSLNFINYYNKHKYDPTSRLVQIKLINKKLPSNKNLKNIKLSNKGSPINFKEMLLFSFSKHELFNIMFKENLINKEESYYVLAHSISLLDLNISTIDANIARDVVFSKKIKTEDIMILCEKITLKIRNKETETKEFRKILLDFFVDHSENITIENERFNVSSYLEELKKDDGWKFLIEMENKNIHDKFKDIKISSGVWNLYHKIKQEEINDREITRSSPALEKLKNRENELESNINKLKEQILIRQKEKNEIKRDIEKEISVILFDKNEKRKTITDNILMENKEIANLKSRFYTLHRDKNLNHQSKSWQKAIELYKEKALIIKKLNENFK